MNILIVIAVIILAGGIFRGYKVGFVREAGTAVRLLFAVLLLILILRAVRGYLDHNIKTTVSAAVSIGAVSFIYKLVSYAVSFVELLGKLPLIRDLNRVAGAILGALEAAIIFWALLRILPIIL